MIKVDDDTRRQRGVGLVWREGGGGGVMLHFDRKSQGIGRTEEGGRRRKEEERECMSFHLDPSEIDGISVPNILLRVSSNQQARHPSRQDDDDHDTSAHVPLMILKTRDAADGLLSSDRDQRRIGV